MSRLSIIKRAGAAVTVLGCVALLAAPAAAQTTATASIAATADVLGIAPLTAVGVADLDFGTVLAGAATTIADPATQGGRFDLTGEPLANLTVGIVGTVSPPAGTTTGTYTGTITLTVSYL
jgi:hypothetical protein